ncbi:MAG: TRAP transporter large permease [Lutisporaceae bacterium]|jgi:C4-dicarboxylate transporter DctM subunit
MGGILLFTFLGCLALGVPIAFSIAIAGTVVLIAGDVNLLIVVQRLFAATDSFSLVAVPFFILAGDLLARGEMSKTLVAFAEACLGKLKGGLSAVSVLASMFFAAISGSGAATTAAVGSSMIPELEKRGYEVDRSAALIASGGCIGVVIPPSVPMVLYAVIAEQSVTKLFQNGFFPGFMMGGILIAIALYQAKKLNYPDGKAFSFKNLKATFNKAIWALIMPLIILGGIFSGYFTPSEAAGVAVIYSMIASMFIYRDLTLKELGKIMLQSGKTSAIIMIIIACSGVFGWALANWRIPEAIAHAVLAVSTNKYVILMLISVLILIAGVFMETSSAIILLTPVFLPLIKMLGVNLIHFGLIFTVGIAIGMITPPVAIDLFVASSVTNIPIERIAKKVVPYLVGLIIIFLIYVYLPLFIPAIIF